MLQLRVEAEKLALLLRWGKTECFIEKFQKIRAVAGRLNGLLTKVMTKMSGADMATAVTRDTTSGNHVLFETMAQSSFFPLLLLAE